MVALDKIVPTATREENNNEILHTIMKGAQIKEQKSRANILLFFALTSILFSAIFGCGGGVSKTDVQPTDAQPTNVQPTNVQPPSIPSGTETLGTANLSWDAPTSYVDGTPLTPAGYKVYYGVISGHYASVYTIVGNVNSYQVTNLLPGQTYYFVVTSYDNSGNESAYSNEINKFIN